MSKLIDELVEGYDEGKAHGAKNYVMSATTMLTIINELRRQREEIERLRNLVTTIRN